MNASLPDNATTTVLPGDVLEGRFRIVRVLGAGGMGSVFEARHVALGRRCAVKLMAPRLDGRPDYRERFRREATAAAILEHENVAAVLDLGETPSGAPFLVMEYLDGENLASLLATEGPLPPSRAADIVVQACRGVDAIHASGVIHRDLKPTNLFVCRHADGRDLVKVLDFGVAKVSTPDTGPDVNTRTGAVLGTPHYMAPEQARGEKQLSRRVDVYALGTILYECLSGQRAHHGASYNEVLYHVMTQQPESLRALRPSLPDSLVATVEHAMAQDPEDRFATAADLAEALRSQSHVLSLRTLPASEDTLPGTLDEHVCGTLRPDAPIGNVRGSASRFRPVLVLGVALLFVLAFVGWVRWTTDASATARDAIRNPAAEAKTPEPPASEVPKVAPAPTDNTETETATTTPTKIPPAHKTPIRTAPPASTRSIQFARENPYR